MHGCLIWKKSLYGFFLLIGHHNFHVTSIKLCFKLVGPYNTEFPNPQGPQQHGAFGLLNSIVYCILWFNCILYRRIWYEKIMYLLLISHAKFLATGCQVLTDVAIYLHQIKHLAIILLLNQVANKVRSTRSYFWDAMVQVPSNLVIIQYVAKLES